MDSVPSIESDDAMDGTNTCLLRRIIGWRGRLLVATVTIASVWGVGCQQDNPQIARVRNLTAAVHTVSEAGLMLDEHATPEQVVYAMLQAIKDDVRAGNDLDARAKAIDRQLALCAPEEIHLRFGRKQSIETREECIYRVVRLWGAVVSYYVDSLDADLDTLAARMDASVLARGRANSAGTSELRRVVLPLADPQAPDDSKRRALLRVDLAKESGFWRVCHVGYQPRPVVKTPVAPSTDESSSS